MNKLSTTLRLLLGLLFCFISIGAFVSGDNGIGILILIFGLLLIPGVSKAIFKKKNETITASASASATATETNSLILKSLITTSPSIRKSNPLSKELIPSQKGFIINPTANFKIELYNAPQDIIQEVKKILDDQDSWQKEKLLMPLFTQYNIKCVQVDDYVAKYKPVYLSTMEGLKSKSPEYQQASEMDKADIEAECFIKAGNMLYERASCDLDLLFASNEIDLSLDDELLKQYGFETLTKYLGFALDFDKVRVDYDRNYFEDLLSTGLAISGEEIPIQEILKVQTLKILNKIANKEESFFKRKDKAIEFIFQDEGLQKNIGSYVAMRRIFKLKELPSNFQYIDLNELSTSFAVVKEQIKVITETYRNSVNYARETDTEIDPSFFKGYTIEKQEDYNSEFVCLRAREVCKIKYSSKNRPQLPLHLGCNCYLKMDI